MMVFLWGKSWQNSKNVRYRNFLVKPLVGKCPLENNATYGDRAKRPQGPIICMLLTHIGHKTFIKSQINYTRMFLIFQMIA